MDVLFVLTDDQRSDVLGVAGNPVAQTPNLDALAGQGVLFRNNFVTTSICPTSRASIVTGLYASKHGVWDFGTALPAAHRPGSYPEVFRRAGYRTIFVGKWGLPLPSEGELFDDFRGFPGQGQYYEGDGTQGRHLTERLGDQTLDALDGLGQDERFCLSVSFKAPHNQAAAPWYVPIPEAAALYADWQPPRPANGGDEYYERLPDALTGLGNPLNRGCWRTFLQSDSQYAATVRGYYALITGVDMQIGRILQKLRDLGRDRTTAIVFTSDNGLFLGEHGLCGKWLAHEESIRTPLIVSDPSYPEGHGRELGAMTLNLDVAPTLLGCAGLDAPRVMDGTSLMPWVRGEDPLGWRKDWFYEHLLVNERIPKVEAVRTDDWKYILYPESDASEREELYDLARDPGENDNLVGDPGHADRLAELRARHAEWVRQVRA